MELKLWDRREFDFRRIEFAELEWKTPCLYLYGSTGSGKTTWALAELMQWEKWEFANCVHFIDSLRRAAGDQRRIHHDLDTLGKYPRMVIDDLGSEPTEVFNNFGTKYNPKEEIETALFRRLDNNLITIITTNLSPLRTKVDDSGARVTLPPTSKDGDPSSLEAVYGPKIWSRIMKASTIYNFRGDRRINEQVSVEKIWEGSGRTKVPRRPEVRQEDEHQVDEKEYEKMLRTCDLAFLKMISKYVPRAKAVLKERVLNGE
jgi:hypothetical protein